MKYIHRFIVLTGIILFNGRAKCQTVWDGPPIQFIKTNNAVWTLPENQDRISDNVWITRATNQGIFNIKLEAQYTSFSSPSDTEWAYGTTENLTSLTFQDWETTHGSNPPSMVNQDMVLHLISEDIYIDLKFLSWSIGGGGGGFSYQRSTDSNLSISELEFKSQIKIVPNPVSIYFQIFGLREQVPYEIYDMLGTEVQKGISSLNENISIPNLPNGLYILKLKDSKAMKFIKIK